MAGSLNKVCLIGNVGKDPEIKNIGQDRRVAQLTIATSESWKDKSTGEKKEKTEWHRVAIFNDGLIGVVERWVNKGSKLYIEGALQTRKWEKDGVTHYATEIVLQAFNGKLLMLDSGKRDGESRSDTGAGYGGSRAPAGGGLDDIDDDIPF